MLLGDIAHLMKVDPNYQAPAPSEETIQSNSLILVRHAVTDYNTMFASISTQYGPVCEQIKELNTDSKHLDLPLRKEGVYQCEFASKNMDKVNVKYVLVSPMLRTMQTAIHLFKNHPQKNQLRFKIVPLLKETLDCTYSINHNLSKLREIIDPLAEQNGLVFDYSLMNLFGMQDLYQVISLANVQSVNKIYSLINTDRQNVRNLDNIVYESAKNSMINHMKDLYPNPLEDIHSLLHRIDQIKQYLKMFIKLNPLKEDEKCVVVCHSDIIEGITCKGLDEKTKTLIEPTKVLNCQMLPWTLE